MHHKAEPFTIIFNVRSTARSFVGTVRNLISKTTVGIGRNSFTVPPALPIVLAQNVQKRTWKSHTLVHKPAQTPNFA